MGRPSKLSEEQWLDVYGRLVAGESTRALGRAFAIAPNAIAKRFGGSGAVNARRAQVHETAQKLADAARSLQALPPAQREVAVTLADKLRSISESLASAADLGAKTAHRLQALSNAEVAKVDDAEPLGSIESLKNVGILTKLANDSAAIALNLLAANRDAVQKFSTTPPGQSPSAVMVYLPSNGR